jgi:hypothetical protein
MDVNTRTTTQLSGFQPIAIAIGGIVVFFLMGDNYR